MATVMLERVLFEVPQRIFGESWQAARDEIHQGRCKPPIHELFPTEVPDDYIPGGIDKESFGNWEVRMGKSCSDLVVLTRMLDDTPAVLGLKRNNPPYKGMWYMSGGQLFAYMSIAEFLRAKCKKETSLELEPDALMGLYRNDGPDKAASVLAPCYSVFVPRESIYETQPADGHDQWRLFTEADLNVLPEAETHWYPMHVWRRALATAIDFNIR